MSHSSADNSLTNPFRLPQLRGLPGLLLSQLLGLVRLARWYDQRPANLSPAAFCRYALGRIGARSEIVQGSLADIPAQGPLLVVANHPFGGVEGMVLMEQLLQRRPDLKVLANGLLCRIPELAPLFISVDVFRTGVNQGSVRQASAHVASGGALLIFPAGEVSSFQWRAAAVVEADWRHTAALIAQRAGAEVSPVFVEGRNRLRFHMLGLLHPLLRTLLLPREMAAQRGKVIRLRIGRVVPHDDLLGLSKVEATGYLRLNTLLLGQMEQTDTRVRHHQPVIAPQPVAQIRAELAALTPLTSEGHYQLFIAEGAQIPRTLRELGRLRELAFRGAGEGSGQSCDLDRFDQWYQQLILWDEQAGQIAGAYRIGVASDIVARFGVQGLYTHTLFDFGSAFLSALQDPIELGRSFVAPAYQRDSRALYLLWRGVGHFISARQQGPGVLFGPVSISADYSPVLRRLLATVLSLHHSEERLKQWVRPRQPLKEGHLPVARDALAGLADLRRLGRLISRIERGKSMPVLLRHYLALKGRMLCFNVDPAFSNALDGLIVADLRNVSDRIRVQYMGVEGAARYAENHMRTDRNV